MLSPKKGPQGGIENRRAGVFYPHAYATLETHECFTPRRQVAAGEARPSDMIRKVGGLSVFLVAWAMVPFGADAFSDDNDAFDTCKKAEQGAIRGIPSAQFAYGLMYAVGHCSTFRMKQPSKAAEWWQKAAAQGHPDAQYSLGVSYLKGSGVPKNMDTAYRLINEAAQNGSAEARHFLVLCRSDPSNSACR